MATLTMTPVDAPRPNKRFRRSTTSDTATSKRSYTNETQCARSSRSASTSSYPYSARRNSTTSGSNSLTHSNCSHSHSRTSSFSHSSPFTSSSSRSRSAAEARAFVLDPAYSGVGQTQARVFVDERGVAHDPDYRMFPTVPSSPTRPGVTRRGSVTSARGMRCPGGSIGGCSDQGSPFATSPFAGSPFAGYADFATHFTNSAGHEEDSDEDAAARMDIDEDAESEIEWSRLHASTSPPGYGSQEGGQSAAEKAEDGYADFAGMEWDEKEWRREEVVPALDKHDPPTPTTTSTKGKHAASPALVSTPTAGSAPASVKSYPKPKSKTRTKSKSKTESVSSATARGYVPAKRSYDESVQDEWTPSCGYSVRRHWQSFTLRIRFSVFRWRRRLRRVLGAATSPSTGAGVDQCT